MASLSRRLYTGMTNDLERRVWQHKNPDGETFASKYHINRLVFCEAADNVLEAIAREKEIKSWRREKKVALIKAANPKWRDLSEGWDSVDGKSSARGDSSLRSE